MVKRIKNVIISLFGIVLIGFGVWLIVANNGDHFQDGKPYRIGVIAPLSGSGATLGQPMVAGMELAVDEVNKAGGVNGRHVQLLVEDGKLEGLASVNAAQSILTREPDLVNVMFHLPAAKTAPILDGAGVPWIYQAYTRSPLEGSKYGFKEDFDALTGCEKLVAFAKERGAYEKLGVLMANVEYNDLCLEGIKKVDSDVQEYRYAFGEKDFRTLLAQANADGVDRLMTISIDFEYVNMFDQLSELGYPIKIMCATAEQCIFPKVVNSAHPSVLEGTLSIAYVSPNIAESSFGEKLRQVNPGASFADYAWGSVGYEKVQYISEALQECEPGEHKCVAGALENVKGYDSVIGSQGFEDRVLQLDYSMYEYTDGEWQVAI